MIQQLWSSTTLTYIPSGLIGVMTTSRWCHRPTDVTTTPLRDHWEQPRFYIPSHPPSPLLVHRLALHNFSAFCISSESFNGRVLSHSCGYSFGQRAWPSFRDIRISRINRVDTIDSQFLKGSVCYRSTRSSLSILDEISRLFGHFWYWFFFSFFKYYFFFFFLSFLFTGLLVLGEIGKRLGNRSTNEIEFQDDPCVNPLE